MTDIFMFLRKRKGKDRIGKEKKEKKRKEKKWKGKERKGKENEIGIGMEISLFMKIFELQYCKVV